MALELDLFENYLVYSDTITGESLGEYAVNHCVYTEKDDRFIIKEQIDGGTLNILKADVDAGKWQNSSAVVFTQETLRDFLRLNTGFKPASGGSEATLLSQVTTIGATEFANMRSVGVPLLPVPSVGKWHDVKEIIYKYTFGTTPYFGLDTNNLLTIFGGGVGVKYQIYTTRNFLLLAPEGGSNVTIWKQFPQTREEIAFLGFNPAGVTEILPPATLTAFFSRENLTGGDGVLQIEVIYQEKDI